jgi:uncharacterized OsmC-like protein
MPGEEEHREIIVRTDWGGRMAIVRTDWGGRMATRTQIRDFVIETDLPEDKYGSDNAPTPEEQFMAALGSSLLTTFIHICAKSKIEVSDARTEVKLKIEKSEDERKVTDGKMVLWVQADKGLREAIERCFEIARRSSSVLVAVNFPVDLDLEFEDE